MVWQELSVTVPPEYVEPISYLFGKYGHGFSAEHQVDGSLKLRTYLTAGSRRRRAHIEVGVNLVRSIEPSAILQVQDLEDTQWEEAWKSHFNLLRLGQRLVVKPSWIEYEPVEGDLVIELDPGMAFGTGYHPTTRMCMEALEELVQPGMKLLDLGSGSGILTILALRLGAGSAVAVDIDPLAVRTARKNLKAAKLLPQVALVKGSIPHQAAGESEFDLAVANISARILEDRSNALFSVLKPGGRLVASGVIQSQAEQVTEAFLSAGFTLQQSMAHDDWTALVLSKPG